MSDPFSGPWWDEVYIEAQKQIDEVMAAVYEAYLGKGIPFYPDPTVRDIRSMPEEEAARVMGVMIQQPDTQKVGMAAFDSYVESGEDGI